MPAPEETRQLLAIMVADIAGYSRMMAADEDGTFARLKGLQQQVIAPVVERNRGAVVKWTGDGFIAGFASAVDAVRAAIEVQEGARAADRAEPAGQQQRLRIGLTVGDVITVPGDIYGEAVNIAARLQALASEGGITASQMVRDTVRGRADVVFTDKGLVEVRNIPEPVRLFEVRANGPELRAERPAGAELPLIDDGMAGDSRRGAKVVAIVSTIVLAAFGGYFGFRHLTRPVPPAPKPPVKDIAQTPAEGQKKTLETPASGPVPPAVQTDASAAFRAALATRLGVVAPVLSAAQREALAAEYAADAPGKALAVSPATGRTWRVAGRPSGQIAITEALEGCEIVSGTACGAVATNDRFDGGGPNGLLNLRNMPRVAYSGQFDPEKVPTGDFRAQELAHRYPGVIGPKALALHPSGYLQGHSGDPTQAEAERAALAACNAARKGSEVPCQLYAAGDFVVLAQRISEAPAPDTPAIQLDGHWRGRLQDGRPVLVTVLGGRATQFTLADLAQPITKSSLTGRGGSFGDRRYGVRMALEGANDMGIELNAPDGAVNGTLRRQ